MDRDPVPLDLGESRSPQGSQARSPNPDPQAQAQLATSPLAGPSVGRDDEVSRARSRRLVSGYRFGNPPSPVEALRRTDLEDADAPDTVPEIEASQESDSPPLTAELSDVDDVETSAEAEAMGSEMLPAQAQRTQASQPRRRSERGPRSTGWDLTGLNDGEADADASALPADHGSGEYLRGEGGPAGEYRFPKHRLRPKMKGE